MLSFVAKLTVLAPCVGSKYGFQKRPLEHFIRRWHSDNSLWFLLRKRPVRVRNLNSGHVGHIAKSNGFFPSHFLLHSDFLNFSQGVSLKQSISVKR